MTYVDLKVVLGLHCPAKGPQDAVRQLEQAVTGAADEVVMRFWAGHFVGKPAVGHIHHRQNALFCQKVQYSVDSGPAQSRSDAVYMIVHCFGRNMLTQLTDGVQDKLTLGCNPEAGLTQLSIDLCGIVAHDIFVYCERLQQVIF